MTGSPAGVAIERGSGIDPTDPDGKELFARLLGAGDAGGVGTFPYRLDGRQVLEPHAHTGAVAACLTAGSIRFGFGEGFADTIEVAAGDYFAIDAEVGHSEEVTSDEAAEMIVAHTGTFETHPA